MRWARLHRLLESRRFIAATLVFGFVLAASIGLRCNTLGITGAVSGSIRVKITSKKDPLPVKKKSNHGSSDKVVTKTTPAQTVAATQTSAVSAGPVTHGCSGISAAHAGLASAAAPELRRLAQYEQLCGGAITSRTSFFVPTPATVPQAQASAASVAGTLQAYARAGLAPLVFMEPSDTDGNNLDLAAYANGAYDAVLDAYFSSLQAAGISSAAMGTWVFAPEANTPVWTTTDPAIFGQVVAKTATIMKHYFPGAQASIMLDSKSYPVGSTWGGGSYTSLLPYVQAIPKGIIDSFGLQGFPWASPANQNSGDLYDPAIYLKGNYAVEAARTLGIQQIWFNTGTFGTMYANQASAKVTVPAAQRLMMLEGVIQVANQVKSQGFTVSIHIFAQNKANLGEATDWSYWNSQPGDSDASTAFSSFIYDAQAAGLPVWLYDTAD